MINAAHYDGRMHGVPFEVGEDFIAKWDAYLADGFLVSVLGAPKGNFLAIKLMPGERIPPRSEWVI